MTARGKIAILEEFQPGMTQALPSLLLGGLLWFQLAIALHPWWEDGSYYDYGWLVPFLCIWCLWARWQNLAPKDRILITTPLSSIWQVILVLVIVGLAFLRLIERSDPLWRIPIWVHAVSVVALWHGLLHHLTGRSSYFFPVSILALTAVPLPPFVEGAIIHRLTDAVLTYSVPIARLFGLPVEMAGTALMADGRVLQIDDGCSGIRSFQSLLMISIFFGEFFTLTWPRRAIMIVTGFVAGFVCNGLRTLTLTWIFFRLGEHQFHSFHDGAGIVTFALSAILTYLAAWKLAGPVRINAPTGSG